MVHTMLIEMYFWRITLKDAIIKTDLSFTLVHKKFVPPIKLFGHNAFSSLGTLDSPSVLHCTWQNYSITGLHRLVGLHEVGAHEVGKVISPTAFTFPGYIPGIHVRDWVDPRAVVRPKRLSQQKLSKSPSGIEPATFRHAAQCVYQLCHHLPRILVYCILLCNAVLLIASQLTICIRNKLVRHKWVMHSTFLYGVKAAISSNTGYESVRIHLTAGQPVFVWHGKRFGRSTHQSFASWSTILVFKDWYRRFQFPFTPNRSVT